MFDRWHASTLAEKLARPFVHIVFGARQCGKSTLIRSLLPPDAHVFDLADPGERSRFLREPERLIRICQAMPARKEPHTVFVDEVQAVPALFDAVQHLYDGDKKPWRFILCGSSARKLRQAGANLLPGRSFVHHLFPLMMAERPVPKKLKTSAQSVFPLNFDPPSKNLFPEADLIPRLAYGDLPGIVTADEEDRNDMLEGYTVLHLEEEIRREGLVRDWGKFQRFLQLAAAESGQIVNYAAISNEAALSQPTVKAHYQLLEDMFIGFTLPAWTRSPRKQLLSTPRFYLFDLGLRHAAAGLAASPQTVLSNPGPIFEQWVGIELWKRLRYLGKGNLFYMRTKDGAEVDFIVEHAGEIIPIEVKWTENPTASDARHLRTFLAEQKGKAKRGYVVCRCDRPMQLEANITAIPWHDL
ncbi:MAG: ATP-binding protein [Prosthecobacter sp.]|jgi:predicted AAA+ superfamily ATPase|uniref:ATP-binding protein n=1 Tax=Prosthecobacter sp. TaxID=1965333 RepID=UPI0019FA75B6|nr:ATP-binding protein [Prosthecobacter sp.]MBE2282091.1 ATP-binding protein [Prosthecobacter sp.]